MHEFDRSDVEAAGGLAGDEQSQIAPELTGEHHLLLVSAGERRDRIGDAAESDVEFLDLLLRLFVDDLRPHIQALGIGLTVVDVEDHVLADREFRDDAVGRTVFGNEADAGTEAVLDRAADELLPVESDRAQTRFGESDDRLGQFRLSVALDTGDGENLTTPDVEGHIVDDDVLGLVDDGESPDLESRIARIGGFLLGRQRHGAADHLAGQFGLGRLGRGLADDLAAADDRDRVGDRADLTEFVGDEHDRCALLLELAHDRDEFVGLLRSQHGRRLVEDEDLGIPGQSLDDLHTLLCADRQVLDEGVGIDIEVEARGDLLDLLPRLVDVEEPEALRGFVAQRHGFGDGEHGHEHEMLVDHADSRGHGIAGAGELHRLVVDEDLSPIGVVESVEDIHHGGFAGAVLTQQSVDLARLDGEIDVVVRHERSEHLGHPAKLEFHCFRFSSQT